MVRLAGAQIEDSPPIVVVAVAQRPAVVSIADVADPVSIGLPPNPPTVATAQTRAPIEIVSEGAALGREAMLRAAADAALRADLDAETLARETLAAIVGGLGTARIVTAPARAVEHAAPGVVVLPVSQANTIELTLAADVTMLSFDAWPAPGVSQRVEIVIRQDDIGGRAIATWPDAVWVDGGSPLLSSDPYSVSRFVFATSDGGATVFADQIGANYRPPVPGATGGGSGL